MRVRNSPSPGRGASVLVAALAVAGAGWLLAVLPAFGAFTFAVGVAVAWCVLLERQERRYWTGAVPDPEGGHRFAVTQSLPLDVMRAHSEPMARDADRAA